MNLATTYLGLELAHPLMPGASPLVDDLDMVKRLRDAGAAAITMHSLFEEQLTGEQLGMLQHVESHSEAYAEALRYMPPPQDFALGPEEYLEQIVRIKQATGLPVIGSLNGSSPSGWLEYARLIEQAGADALELNIYHVASDPRESAEDVENDLLEIVRRVRQSVAIPLAVKLSPFYSAMANLASKIVEAGADGLVLFNRFYQPDFNLEELSVERSIELSRPNELLLRVQWLAILSAQLDTSLGVTGGIHTSIDAIKACMAGAHAVQVVSVLLKRGPEHLATLLKGLSEWLEEHGYDSLEQARGSLNLARCPNPQAYNRSNYVRLLQSWQD